MNFTPLELKGIINTVSSIALEFGQILINAFNSNISSEEKTSPHDVVTKFDKEGEEFIYKKLYHLYPNFGFLGEEGGYKNFSEENPFWIVDPIDGTLNFARNIPGFCVSIALVHINKSLIGVCYNPITKELFTAAGGMGAFLNGKEIQASNVSTFDKAIISIPPNQISTKKPATVIRRQGSSVLDICYVAKGAIEGYYDACLYPWDFAAASLIASEAGAEIFSLKTKTLDTNKKSDILVANKQMVDKFTKWISTEER